MGIFKNLFGSKKTTLMVECPRCLGKGHVDKADIIRLEKQLYWAPGSCAYCKKTGKVDASQVSKIAVDELYLTKERTNRERKKIINKDQKAVVKAQKQKQLIDDYIDYICILYTDKKNTVEEIAEILITNKPNGVIINSPKKHQKEEYIRYIKEIIKIKQL